MNRKKDRYEKEEQKFLETSKQDTTSNQITNSKLYLLREELEFLRKALVVLKELKG
jgi:hypothetical protein